MFRTALHLHCETLQPQIYGIFRIKQEDNTEFSVLNTAIFLILLIMSEFDIKKIRNELGLTQKELAAELGVDTKTIQNWERGKRIPDSKDGILRKLVLKPHQYAGGEQQNINGDNINGNNVTVHKTDTDKLLEILASKEQSLAKAQEHIDKLLEIIGNLTKND